MEILQQIGVNKTALIQFVIFAIAILFLTKVVFSSYAQALDERENRTKGGEDLAVEFKKKALELQGEYEVKAREVANEIKGIFDAQKAEASSSYEGIVNTARQNAEGLVLENRTKITAAVSSASADLKAQTNTVALAITHKLLGK